MNLELRAWNKYHKEMHSVYEINFDHCIAKTRDNKTGQTYTVGFKDLEIMRKIELKDKTGKSIFEGDIVRFNVRRSFENNSNPVLGAVGIVRFYCECTSLGEWDIAYCYDIHVIGNIYENPEILDNKKWQKTF